MPEILIASNLDIILKDLEQRLSVPQIDKAIREAATTCLAMMKRRVHTDGKDANGQPIGTYSEGYMKVRTGNYGNSKTVSRGKNKGKPKDAGVYTKGEKKGQARPKYNRTGETKVVASLTSQMENDEKVIMIEEGRYGIGFSNELNYNKSQWVEKTYKKRIFSTSEDEKDAIKKIVEKHMTNAFS